MNKRLVLGLAILSILVFSATAQLTKPIVGCTKPAVTSTTTSAATQPVPLFVSILPYPNVTIRLGTVQWFHAYATGGVMPYVTCSWYVNGSLVQSGSYSDFSYFNYTPSSAGSYIVKDTVKDSETPPASASNSTTFTVFGPLYVSLYPYPNSTISQGMSQSFSASAYGGVMPYTFSWYVNGSLVQSGSDPNLDRDFTYTPSSAGFYIVNVTVTDSETPKPASAWDSETLTVTPPVPLSVSISPTHVTQYGGPLMNVFYASAYGGVMPYTFGWYVNGSLVRSGSDQYFFYYSSSSLGSTIVNVTVTDSESPAVSASASATLTVSSPGIPTISLVYVVGPVVVVIVLVLYLAHKKFTKSAVLKSIQEVHA